MKQLFRRGQTATVDRFLRTWQAIRFASGAIAVLQSCYVHCLRQEQGDTHSLDETDGDGIACESLL